MSGTVFSWLGVRRDAERGDEPRGLHVIISGEKKQYRQKSGDRAGRPPLSPEEAERWVTQSPSAALAQMNAVSRHPGSAGWVLAAGAVGVLVSWHFSVILAVLPTGLAAALFRRVRAADAQRRRFHLEYEMDAEARERWTLLNHALAALTRTERIWQITTHSRAQGWKRASGASSLVTRTRADLRRETPARLSSNLTPYCLCLGPKRWLFFPDRLYVLQNGGYEAVEYAHLRLKTDRMRFLEEEQVPRDAQILGKPWDRRMAPNPPGVAITEYGALEIEVRPGLEAALRAALHVSSVGAADQFAALFGSFQSYRRSDGAMPTPPAPSADCYRRLGLPSFCTQEEAARQFRRLVLAHHPDRVRRDTPDAQAQANAEMQEIVLAYKDLKRLRGW